MKLYQKYKEAIRQIGKVELAWFTTFNLDPDLTERFLLSALVGMEASQLKTAEDYEAMNYDLNELDIRILYDYRALNLNSPKRTSVDFIPVNPAEKLKKDKGSIFHPKVIFLKGEHGAYLITGSANLSISAWSSNKESVLIKKIESRKNAGQIITFFRKLGVKYNLNKWVNSLSDIQTDWDFVHSLEPDFNLFKKLTDDSSSRALTIWSPYFAKNTLKLLERIKTYGFTKLTIVPNVNEAGKVSIEQTELQRIIEADGIAIKHFINSGEEQQPMHHAKVWLTEDKLAVGSWNCSFVATGEGKRKQNNIEAGIIVNIKSANVASTLNKSIISYKADATPQGQTDDELKQEWEDVLNNFEHSIIIGANWERFVYEFDSSRFPEADYRAYLPDKPNEAVSLNSVNGRSFHKRYTSVLKNKFYTVVNAKGEEVFKGYLQESGKKQRPVYTYVKLPDLFESLIKHPARETPNKVCRYKLSSEEGEDLQAEIQITEQQATNSYYIMFVSFQNLYDEIKSNADNKTMLDRLGYRLPGSLINIRQLVAETISNTVKSDDFNPEKEQDKLLYYYFIIQEVNRCIGLFNDYADIRLDKIARDLQEEVVKLINFSPNDIKFINKLRKEYDYEKLK